MSYFENKTDANLKAIVKSELTLCEALEALSDATWLEIKQGFETGQPLDEESITTYDLMRLAAAVPAVLVEKHSKKREWKTGADWEIWAGRPGAFVGFRVQAKILKTSSGRYESLFSSRKKANYQLDKLITNAETADKKIYPIYSFYNYLPHSHSSLSGSPCRRLTQDPRLGGWTIASAYALRNKLQREPSKRLSDLSPMMVPITCLFCCTQNCAGRRTDEEQSLAERIATATANTLFQPEGMPAAEVHDVAPVYIERLFKGESPEFGWEGPSSSFVRDIIQSRQLPSGISRVMLVRDIV